MTREIKFRAYIKSENRITDVCTIDFYSSFIIDEEWVEYNMSEIVLMQRTWLYDKNNQPIYEWDIVRHKLSDFHWYVNSVAERKEFEWWPTIHEPSVIWFRKFDEPEIIWNIYENPHFIPNS